jgi:group I intron endonuclease
MTFRSRSHPILDQLVEVGRREGTVYLITNLLTEERYVGATTRSLRTRWRRHRREKRSRSSPLHRAMMDYGFENFRIEPFVSCIDLSALAELEAQVIADLHPEYNRAAPENIWSPQGWAVF